MKVLVLLKHIFIPHDENDYKPHFFRELSVSIIMFVSVFLLGSSAGSSFFIHKTVLGAEIAASVLIDLTNESRLAYNQIPLVRSSKLDEAASLKGEDMASKEYFSHNSPEGVTPWYWFNRVGYKFLYAGENLAINFTDSKDLEEAWLNSPTHRANIMNVDFREIGMATIKGTYKNYPTIYVVQMFGTPAYGKTIEDIATSTSITDKSNEERTASITTTTSSTSTQKTLAGDVKGESIKTTTKATSTIVSATSSPLQNIIATQDIAVVKNTSVATIPANIKLPRTEYSTWYQRLVFKGSYYVENFYKILLLVIAFALVTMIMIEVRKQHYIHILYGVSLLILLTIFIYINQGLY